MPGQAVGIDGADAGAGAGDQTRHPVEAVAAETGFAGPERMRRAFLRAFGQPPQAMRRSAREGVV